MKNLTKFLVLSFKKEVYPFPDREVLAGSGSDSFANKWCYP
jgi:hypothetical protein